MGPGPGLAGAESSECVRLGGGDLPNFQLERMDSLSANYTFFVDIKIPDTYKSYSYRNCCHKACQE